MDKQVTLFTFARDAKYSIFSSPVITPENTSLLSAAHDLIFRLQGENNWNRGIYHCFPQWEIRNKSPYIAGITGDYGREEINYSISFRDGKVQSEVESAKYSILEIMKRISARFKECSQSIQVRIQTLLDEEGIDHTSWACHHPTSYPSAFRKALAEVWDCIWNKHGGSAPPGSQLRWLYTNYSADKIPTLKFSSLHGKVDGKAFCLETGLGMRLKIPNTIEYSFGAEGHARVPGSLYLKVSSYLVREPGDSYSRLMTDDDISAAASLLYEWVKDAYIRAALEHMLTTLISAKYFPRVIEKLIAEYF